jgi:hypothetical protein
MLGFSSRERIPSSIACSSSVQESSEFSNWRRRSFSSAVSFGSSSTISSKLIPYSNPGWKRRLASSGHLFTAKRGVGTGILSFKSYGVTEQSFSLSSPSARYADVRLTDNLFLAGEAKRDASLTPLRERPKGVGHEWREDKDILGQVSRFPEVGEASSPYFS